MSQATTTWPSFEKMLARHRELEQLLAGRRLTPKQRTKLAELLQRHGGRPS